MKEDFVCAECGHQYEESGDGKCYVCGGNIIPIEEVGQQEETEYPEDLMEEAEATPPEELEDWEEPSEEV